MCACACVYVYVCDACVCELFGRTDFFLPGPPSQSFLGMGSGATEGERHEDTKEEVRHCQDPKEEGWRSWQSCLAPSQFLLKMARPSCLVCICYCAGVVGEGRACLLNWGLEWEGHLSADPIWTLHSNK